MNIEESLSKVIGDWQGQNLMRLIPDEEYSKSDSRATVSLLAHNNAATIAYTWADKGQAQDGILLITNGPETSSVVAVWVDSWHQLPQWMELKGHIDDQGLIHLEAMYTADGKECGWRIHLDGTDANQFRLTMDNIYDDMDYQAVKATYAR